MNDVGTPSRRRNRWLVLLGFTAVAGTSQMLWLNFAPILLQIQQRFQVGELYASTLVLVFPLVYVRLRQLIGGAIHRSGR